MSQTRIVLKDEVADIAQELLELTRLSNISELTSVLYSRYAKHLKETWEVPPQTPIAAQQNNAFAPAPLPSIEPIPAFPDSIEL